MFDMAYHTPVVPFIAFVSRCQYKPLHDPFTVTTFEYECVAKMTCLQYYKNHSAVASTSLPSNTNAPIWSLSIEIHGKFLLGRLLLSTGQFSRDTRQS